MIDLLRAEWIKLHTVTMHRVLTVIAVAFPLIVTLLTAFFQGDNRSYDTGSLVGTLSGTSLLSALLFGVLAATAVTGEFGFGTIRPTFAATPSRGRVVLGKAIVSVVFTAAAATAIVLVGWFAGRSIAEGQGATIDLDRLPTAVSAMVGIVAVAATLAVIGLGLGLLFRSTPATVTALIAWPLIGEGLIGALIGVVIDSDHVQQWMPFQAGFQAALHETQDGGPSRLGGGLYFAGVALAILALGTWSTNRRDA